MEEKKPKKKLSMGLIIVISLALAFIVTLSLFFYEDAAYHSTGHSRFEKECFGGEVIQYQGLFWGITHYAPMTSVDEPVAIDGPDIYPLRGRVALSIILISGASWAVLCILTKRFKPVLIAAGSIAVIYFGLIGIRKGTNAWKNTPKEVAYIRITTTDFRPGDVTAIDYPQKVLFFSKAGMDGQYGYLYSEKMSANMISPDKVSKKQLKALIEASRNVRKNTYIHKDKPFTYRIEVCWKTNDGYGSAKVSGFGGYPEGWEEFISIVNEICGEEYLSKTPDTPEFTAQWFTENFGITDADLPNDMTVEDYLTSTGINLKTVSGTYDSSMPYRYNAKRALDMYIENLK